MTPRRASLGSGLQVANSSMSGPKVFSLQTSTNATVALWAGGRKQSIPGGPAPASPKQLPVTEIRTPRKRRRSRKKQSSGKGGEGLM